MYRIASLVARDAAALETTTGASVVLWDPTCLLGRSAELSRLFETVRRLFQFEARFGSLEVWPGKPGGDPPVPSGGGFPGEFPWARKNERQPDDSVIAEEHAK